MPSSISTVLVDDVVADGVEEGFDCIVVLGYGKAAAIAAVVDLWCAARHVTAHSSQLTGKNPKRKRWGRAK